MLTVFEGWGVQKEPAECFQLQFIIRVQNEGSQSWKIRELGHLGASRAAFWNPRNYPCSLHLESIGFPQHGSLQVLDSSASLLAKGASCMDFPDLTSESHVNTTVTFHQIQGSHKPTEMHERGQRLQLNEGNAKATCGIAVGWKIWYNINTKEKKRLKLHALQVSNTWKVSSFLNRKWFTSIFLVYELSHCFLFSSVYKFLVCQIVSQKCISN